MRALFAAVVLSLTVPALRAPAPAPPERAAETRAKKTESKKPLSDEQIRTILIKESIAAYDGNCPCPYSRARNGSLCGKRSAYSREGGAAPLCYAKDVSAEMVQRYRDENPEAS